MNTLKFLRKWILRFLSGCGCLTILFFLLIVTLLMFGIKGDSQRRLSEKNILVIDISMPIFEGPNDGDWNILFSNEAKGLSTYKVCEKIRLAKTDPSIMGILITGNFSDTQTNFSQITEIRRHLEDFRNEQKPVFTYLENGGIKEYFLASCSTEIIMNPFSELDIKGISLTSVFFGKAFEKYGINAQVIKAGDYKSFGEIFTLDKMSNESRENLSSVANDLWNCLVEKISASRNTSSDNFKEISDKDAILNAETALQKNLIDSLSYRDELVSKLIDYVGMDEVTKSFNQCDIRDYAIDKEMSDEILNHSNKEKIALLYMTGNITSGNGFIDEIGSEYYCKLIRKLKNDKTIKAVVLRINSGGGSAYASEIIRREVELLAKEKPIIASVSGMAASGAYWIATAANKIICEEESIIGSIGVFAIHFSIKKIGEDYGITFDSVKTSPFADLGSMTRDLNESEVKKIQHTVNEIYKKFESLVEKSRSMNKDELEKVIGGKIWTGSGANGLKLYDELGGICSAIFIASNENKIYVSEYPKTTFEDIIKSIFKTNEYFAKSGFEFLKLKSLLEKFKNISEKEESIRTEYPISLSVE